MSATALQPVASQAGPARTPSAVDAAATRKLGALRALGRPLDPQDPRLAREAATLLTSQLFFAPLLAEMRKLPFGKTFGYGGRMEDAFGEQLDLQIADAVARSDDGFTNQLAEQLARSQQATDPAELQASWPTRLQAGAGIEPSED